MLKVVGSLAVLALLVSVVSAFPPSPVSAQTTCPTSTDSDDADTVVSISDSALQRALEKKLGKTASEDITRGDMRELTTLKLTGRGISNMEGLQHATNLTWLDLSNNNIGDSGVISFCGLSSLTGLVLGDNDLTTLDVAGLTSLLGLLVPDNDLASISNLGQLTSLKKLYVASNDLDDLSADLSGVENLRKLINVNLGSNDFTSLSIPSGWGAKLRVLFISYSPQLTSLTLPTSLTSLKTLHLSRFGRATLSLTLPSELVKLQVLNLDGTNLSSLDVSPYTELRYLRLPKTLSSIDLTGLDDLRRVDYNCDDTTLTGTVGSASSVCYPGGLGGI